MGNSVLEFESIGGHGCDRDTKVGEVVHGCNKMGCPDCEARRAVKVMLTSGVGSFVRARFVHWPGTDTEVIDEFSIVGADGKDVDQWGNKLTYFGPGCSIKVTRRRRDFFRNEEKAP